MPSIGRVSSIGGPKARSGASVEAAVVILPPSIRRSAMTTASGAGDGPHREDADDDRRRGIRAQFEAHLAVADETGDEVSLPLGQAHENASVGDVNSRDVVEIAHQLEAATQLMERDIRSRLDESTQLRGCRPLLLGGH